MAVPQTSTCVVTLGAGTSASYTMLEPNWKVIDVQGKVLVAGSLAANAAVAVTKNGSIPIAPLAGSFVYIEAAGTQLQKNSAAGTRFRPVTFTSSATNPVLLQGDTLNLTSDTGGQVEVYITLQRV